MPLDLGEAVSGLPNIPASLRLPVHPEVTIRSTLVLGVLNTSPLSGGTSDEHDHVVVVLYGVGTVLSLLQKLCRRVATKMRISEELVNVPRLRSRAFTPQVTLSLNALLLYSCSSGLQYSRL